MDEFAINWIRGEKTAQITAPNGSGLKNKIIKLATEHPDDAVVIRTNKDGQIFAHVPVKWIKVSAPRQMSDEQRAEAAERLKRMRSNNGREA